MSAALRIVLAGLLVGVSAYAAAQPAFRGAASAATSNTPVFRGATAASYGAGVRFRSAASAASNTGSLSVSRPSGTAANDVMIAAVGVRPSTATIAAPAGWTLVRRTDNNNGGTNSLAVFHRLASAGEPSSYVWNVSGATEAVGGIQSFTGVDPANPIDVESGQATAISLAHATPSVTTTVANAMVVTAHTFATSTTWTPPSGMTEAFDVQYQPVATNLGQSIEGNYAVQAAAAATGAKSATAAGGAGAEAWGATHILALRPAAPALNIGFPANATASDMMIASVAVRPSSASIVAPSGWTLVRRTDNQNGGTNSLAVYRKLVGASEPASYSWDVSGATEAVGGIQSFSGIDPLNPIDAESGQATNISLTHATPSITTSGPNAMIVTAHTFATSTTWSPPSGMTEGFDTQFQPVAANLGQSIEGSHALQAATGATGTKSATAAGGSGAEAWGVTHIIALRRAVPTITIVRPTGTVQNDVMIAAIGVRPAAASVSAPSGWTLVRRVDNGTNNSLLVYRKAAGGSEPESYAWQLSGAVHAAAGIQCFSSVDTANPIDAEAGQTTPSSLTHATPSVSTTVANAMVVTAHTFPTSIISTRRA